MSDFYTLTPACSGCSLPEPLTGKYRTADGPALKVALYILQTGGGSAESISDALCLTCETVQRALGYWKAAGLITYGEDTETRRGAAIEVPPQRVPAVQSDPLTPERAAELTLRDPAVAVLLQETQRFIGRTLDAAESRTLLELYACDELQVDVILMLVAYCLPRVRNRRSLCSMVSRIAQDWRDLGIVTPAEAEKQIRKLELREQREDEVARALELKDPGFTKSQKALIAKWYEEYGYDAGFVREAFLAKGTASLAAIGRQLQSWYNSGYTSLKQVRAAGAAPNAPSRSSASRRKGGGSLLKKTVHAGSKED